MLVDGRQNCEFAGCYRPVDKILNLSVIPGWPANYGFARVGEFGGGGGGGGGKFIFFKKNFIKKKDLKK